MDDLKDVLYAIDNTSMRNVVLLGFTPDVIDEARKHLEELSISGKEEVIISFKKEDYEAIDNFVKSQCMSEYQDMMRYLLTRDHIYYLITKQIKMSVPEKGFLESYENSFEAIKRNDLGNYYKTHAEVSFGYTGTIVPSEELPNFRVNFFVDDYNNPVIQEVINSLISSRRETIFVYSSADNLLTNKCGESYIQTIHDYSPLNSARLTKEISDTINRITHSEDREYVPEKPVKQTKVEVIDKYKYKTLADCINGPSEQHNVVFLGQDHRRMQNTADLIRDGKYKEIAVTFHTPTRNAVNDFIAGFEDSLTEEEINQIYREYILYEVLKQLKHKYSEAKELSKKIKPLIQAILAKDFDKYITARFERPNEESYSLASLGIIIDERINFINVPFEPRFPQFQHQINDYFNKYCYVTISTNADELNNYECSDGTTLKAGLDFEEVITPRIDSERKIAEKKKAKEAADKINFWYPMENYVKGSKKFIPIPKSEYYFGDGPKNYPKYKVDLSDVHHDYYGIKALLEQLPVESLPVSKDILSRITAENLRQLIDQTIIDTQNGTFVAPFGRIIILGLDIFKKKAKVYRKSPITTVDRFYKGYDERKQFVIANEDQLFNYIIEQLTIHKRSRFMPISSVRNSGTYNGFPSKKDFINAIMNADERILESISLYMEQSDMTKEEPFKNAVKRLIHSPSQERSIVKRGI